MDSTLQATQAWSLHFDLLLYFIKIPLAAALLLVFISTYTIHAKGRKCGCKGRLPPGPPPWPIVGNLLQTGSVPHVGMRKLTQKYGPLVYLKLGVVKAVVTDDPKFVMEFLKKQDHVFASRPKNIASEYFTYGGQDIAFSPYGAHWRSMRRLCLFELLTPKRIEYFRQGRLEEVKCMMKEVLACSSSNQAINLRDTFGALSSNTLTRMILGKRFFGSGDSGPAEAAEHKALIYAAFALINAFNVGDYIPFLRPFDLHGHERSMRKIMMRVDKIYDAIVDEHRRRRKEAGPEESHSNFVDQLLSLPGENEEENLRRTTIKAILIDMVAAGTDTSSITSEWTMAELLKHPELMENVRAEIDKVVGTDKLVEESDLSSLQQLKATVKEIFRLHPVGRNPEVWENPEKFRPQRFLTGDNVELSDGNLRIVPFGAGRRGCPGATLGSSVVLLGLARLIQAFHWSPATQSLNLKEAHGLMVLEEPLQAFASPRLSPHLYS
ncbi:hypothetical protein GOP47_0000522 [Adiantum capillus-veneris]|uniref:Cytochrome P450 n=1 Tax=Adiantum capillus-veneris TaxID=13818 RepID=A0A9D4ZQT1_ADICA|nr:hypothetical protein GOP47_0000522 [Adiantum capillus-veneris]